MRGCLNERLSKRSTLIGRRHFQRLFLYLEEIQREVESEVYADWPAPNSNGE